MRPVYILRHVSHESAGSLEGYLAEAGTDVRFVDLFAETPRQLPVEEAAGLVVMGGPMSVHDVDEYPFLAAEVNWIERAVRRQVPLLGICLGSQLLAKAMGADVYENGAKEIGWYPLELLPATAEDPLFAGCQATETVFQWHGDTFDLPPGAALLALSELCERQAFRVGPCAWGLQFHIEITPEMVYSWLSEPCNCGVLAQADYIAPAAIHATTPSEYAKMEPFGRRVLSRFAAICAAHAADRL